MAARIPQMYEVRRPQHPPSPSDSNPNPDPFATPNASVTNLNEDARNSTNLSSIGGLLLSNTNQRSWDDEPLPATRSSPAQNQGQDYNHANLHARVQSLEHDGQSLDDDPHTSYFSDASGPIAPARVGATPPLAVTPGPRTTSRAAVDAGARSGPGPVAFPTPGTPQSQHFALLNGQQRGPSPSPGLYAANPGAAESQPHPQFGAPPPSSAGPYAPTNAAPGASILQPRPQRPTVQVSLPITPLPVFANAAPVSPMLAAPPRAHFSPLAPSPSPGLGPGVVRRDTDNDSIRGHDFLREKNATFREGEEEVFTPFSPRARQAGPRVRAGGRKSVYSTVDFWKRFSTVAKGGHSKESSFLMERRRTIWRNPMFVVPLVLVSCLSWPACEPASRPG